MSADEREELEVQLSAYLDGELTADERAEVEARLAADPQARALLEELRATVQAVHSLPRATASGDLMDSIRSRLERRALLDEPASRPAPAGRFISIGTRWVAAAGIVLMTSVAGYVLWSFRHQPEPAAPRHEELAWNDRAAPAAAERERADALARMVSKDKEEAAGEDDAADSKQASRIEHTADYAAPKVMEAQEDRPLERRRSESSGVTAGDDLLAVTKKPGRTAGFGGRPSYEAPAEPPAAAPAPPATPPAKGFESGSKYGTSTLLGRESTAAEGRQESGAIDELGDTIEWSVRVQQGEPTIMAGTELRALAEGGEPPPPQVVELVYADAGRQKEAVEELRSQFNFRLADGLRSEHPSEVLKPNERLGETRRGFASAIGEALSDTSYGYSIPQESEEQRRSRGREAPASRGAEVVAPIRARAPAAPAAPPAQAGDLARGAPVAKVQKGAGHYDLYAEEGWSYSDEAKLQEKVRSRPAGGVTVMQIDLPDRQAAWRLLADVEQSQAGAAVIRTLDLTPDGAAKPAPDAAKSGRSSIYHSYADELQRSSRQLGQIVTRYANERGRLSETAPAQEPATAPAEDEGFARRQGLAGEGRLGFGIGGSDVSGAGVGGIGGGFGGFRTGDTLDSAATAPAAGEPTTQPLERFDDFDVDGDGMLDNEALAGRTIRLYFRVQEPATRPASASTQPASAPSP